MAEQETKSTPHAAPAFKLRAEANTVEEFCVAVAEALQRENAFILTTSKSKTAPKPYGTFKLGTGNSAWNTKHTLTTEQSKRLNTVHGAPIDLSFSMALLDLTPINMVPGRVAERIAATAISDARKAASISDDVFLAELKRRGIKTA